MAILGIETGALQSGQFIETPAPASSTTRCFSHDPHVKKISDMPHPSTGGLTASMMIDKVRRYEENHQNINNESRQGYTRDGSPPIRCIHIEEFQDNVSACNSKQKRTDPDVLPALKYKQKDRQEQRADIDAKASSTKGQCLSTYMIASVGYLMTKLVKLCNGSRSAWCNGTTEKQCCPDKFQQNKCAQQHDSRCNNRSE